MDLGISDAPPAARATRPGWRDPRLWAGVALVATSVLVGVKVVGGADDTVEVWAAADDLAPGQPVAQGDLVARRVRFGEEDDVARYLKVGDELPEDATLSRAVGEGELLPAAALAEEAGRLVEVPLWAPYDAVPGDLRPGALVDVWVTPAIGGESQGAAQLVLDDVVVVSAPGSADRLGPSGNRQVVVGVEADDDEAVGVALAAARDDRVAITRQG